MMYRMVTLKPYKTPDEGNTFSSKTNSYGRKYYAHHANNIPNNAEKEGGESPIHKGQTFRCP